MAKTPRNATVPLALVTAAFGLIAIVQPLVGGIAAAAFGVTTALAGSAESARLEAALRQEITSEVGKARAFAFFMS